MSEEAWVEEAKRQLEEQKANSKFRLPTEEEYELCKQLIQTTEPDVLTIEMFPHAVLFMANAYLTMCGRYEGIKQLAFEMNIPEVEDMDFQWCCDKISISPIIEGVLGPNELSSLLRVVSQLLADRFLGYSTVDEDVLVFKQHMESFRYNIRQKRSFELLPFVVKNKQRYEDLPSGTVGIMIPFTKSSSYSGGRCVPCVFDGFTHGHEFLDNRDIRISVEVPNKTGYFVSDEYLSQEIRTPIFVTEY